MVAGCQFAVVFQLPPVARFQATAVAGSTVRSRLPPLIANAYP